MLSLSPSHRPLSGNSMGLGKSHQNHRTLARAEYKIRQMRDGDISDVSFMCHEAFKDSAGGFLSPASQTVAQWERQFSVAVQTKRSARREFWFLKPEERVMARETLWGVYKGKKTYMDGSGQSRKPKPSILRKLYIFVVQESDTNEIVGCASISMARCESALPPPFPTTKPFRCYASNIVVKPGFRRQGLGKRLVQQCERVARLWGEKSIWLHVDADNDAALALYDTLGYQKVEYFALYGNGRTLLKAKHLPPIKRSTPRDIATVGKMKDNVFIWE